MRCRPLKLHCSRIRLFFGLLRFRHQSSSWLAPYTMACASIVALCPCAHSLCSQAPNREPYAQHTLAHTLRRSFAASARQGGAFFASFGQRTKRTVGVITQRCWNTVQQTMVLGSGCRTQYKAMQSTVMFACTCDPSKQWKTKCTETLRGQGTKGRGKGGLCECAWEKAQGQGGSLTISADEGVLVNLARLVSFPLPSVWSSCVPCS